MHSSLQILRRYDRRRPDIGKRLLRRSGCVEGYRRALVYAASTLPPFRDGIGYGRVSSGSLQFAHDLLHELNGIASERTLHCVTNARSAHDTVYRVLGIQICRISSHSFHVTVDNVNETVHQKRSGRVVLRALRKSHVLHIELYSVPRLIRRHICGKRIFVNEYREIIRSRKPLEAVFLHRSLVAPCGAFVTDERIHHVHNAQIVFVQLSADRTDIFLRQCNRSGYLPAFRMNQADSSLLNMAPSRFALVQSDNAHSLRGGHRNIPSSAELHAYHFLLIPDVVRQFYPVRVILFVVDKFFRQIVGVLLHVHYLLGLRFTKRFIQFVSRSSEPVQEIVPAHSVQHESVSEDIAQTVP